MPNHINVFALLPKLRQVQMRLFLVYDQVKILTSDLRHKAACFINHEDLQHYLKEDKLYRLYHPCKTVNVAGQWYEFVQSLFFLEKDVTEKMTYCLDNFVEVSLNEMAMREHDIGRITDLLAQASQCLEDLEESSSLDSLFHHLDTIVGSTIETKTRLAKVNECITDDLYKIRQGLDDIIDVLDYC